MVRGNSTLELAQPTKIRQELHGRGTKSPPAPLDLDPFRLNRIKV
jgi:hypothetical protein